MNNIDYENIPFLTMDEYRDIFTQFQKAQVIRYSGEVKLVGKYVFVDECNGTWFIFISAASELVKGHGSASLSKRKLGSIVKTLPTCDFIEIEECNGEMMVKTKNLEWLKKWLFENRKKLGLFKRRPGNKNPAWLTKHKEI